MVLFETKSGDLLTVFANSVQNELKARVSCGIEIQMPHALAEVRPEREEVVVTVPVERAKSLDCLDAVIHCQQATLVDVLSRLENDTDIEKSGIKPR